MEQEKRSLLGVNLLGGHHRWLISRLYVGGSLVVVVVVVASKRVREREKVKRAAIDH